jgi:hypothetical protein
MSFDVFLQRFADGQPAQANREAVREVLNCANYSGPDEFGFYVISLPDGVEAEFSAKGLQSENSFTGCAFHIRGFSDALMQFMFDIARAGEMVIMPAMEGNPLVMVSEQHKQSIPADFWESLQPVVIDSPGELGAVLSGGFEGWSTYRAQVLASPSGADKA